MYKRLTLALSLALLQACGGSGSDEPEVPPGTVGFSGTASGIAGDITLAINGQNEDISENGSFSLATRINEGDSYLITVASTEQNLNCEVVNGTGTALANVTNLEVNCDGENQTAYSLNDLAFNVESPSIVTFAFHLIDRYTGNAITDITRDNVTDYIEVLENDLPISPSESFLEVDVFEDFNAEYTTVFVVDVSSSLLNEDLDIVKTSIINVVLDEQTGESKLDPNQSVSILTFDGDVETVITASKDPHAIKTALEQVEIGGNSTNLYGAISEGAASWDNVIALEQIQYGAMVLFTDGGHNSDNTTPADIAEDVAGKDVFFIAIGSEADTAAFEQFTSSENIFEIDDVSEVVETLTAAIEDVKTFEDGLYLLSYATPKRAGDHSLTIKTRDDYRCDTAVTEMEQNQVSNSGNITECKDEVSHDFNADNFADVEATLQLAGTTVTLVNELDWQVKLRWSRETPNYDWSVNVCYGDISYQLSDDESRLHLSRTEDSLSIARIMVEETNSGQEAESYLIMATNQSEIDTVWRIDLERLCN